MEHGLVGSALAESLGFLYQSLSERLKRSIWPDEPTLQATHLANPELLPRFSGDGLPPFPLA
jgi:hypothetical protein